MHHSTHLLPALVVAGLLAIGPLAEPAQAQDSAWDLEFAIAASEDDSEEFLRASRGDPQRWPQGFSYRSSSDLELGVDPAHGPQMVGLRFGGVEIPAGARVAAAALSFTADSDQAGALDLVVAGEASSDPIPFAQDSEGEGSSDLSSRPRTNVTVSWRPGPWRRGESYRSTDLARVVQASIDEPGWRSGDPITLLIAPAAGSAEATRSAYSYDSRPELAPRLLIRLAADPADEIEVEEVDPAPASAARLEPGEQLAEPGGEAGERPDDEAPELPDEMPATERAVEPEGEPVERRDVAGGEVRRARYPVSASHALGVRGSVLLSDYGTGGTVMAVLLEDAIGQASYRVSLHLGECGSLGEALGESAPVAGARPLVTVVLPFEFDELTLMRHHLNVFRVGDERTSLVGCAEIGS